MRRLLLTLLFLPLFCLGQIPDPKPGTYVNDNTSSLTAAELLQLNKKLYQLEQQTTIQVAILLINDLPSNTTIEDYARNVGRKWKVGKDYNGLVYVAALQERKQRMEVARHLEGDIPDITAYEILESLKPYLKKKDYYLALDVLIAKINQRVGIAASNAIDTTQYLGNQQESLNTPLPVERTPTQYEIEKAEFESWKPGIFVILVLAAVAFIIWAWRYKRKYREMYTINGVYTGIGSAYYTNYIDTTDFNTYNESSDFGDWGGDGGGDGFDGGGASGDW